MHSLISALEGSGVRVIRDCEVYAITASGRTAVGLETSQGSFKPDIIVIAAGYRSAVLLKTLNLKLDLQPGKGYSFRVQTSKPIRYPALLSDARVSVTPLGEGMTVFGGGMELGSGNRKIRKSHVNQILRAAKQFYPSESGLQISRIWQGHRPCSFDGMPFIGRTPGFQNVYVATGHSMMGVTLAPATGKLLSEMITGEKMSLDTSPFRIDR